MKNQILLLLLFLIISTSNGNDFDFVINKSFVIIHKDNDSSIIGIKSLDSLKHTLLTATENFEEEVRIGIRKQVFFGISVNVIDDIDYLDLLNILQIINGYCYQNLKIVKILGIDLRLSNDVNPGNYLCWKNSEILMISKKPIDADINVNCTKGKVRIITDDIIGISKVLAEIVKKTDINDAIYQFCSKDKCIGMNGCYENSGK